MEDNNILSLKEQNESIKENQKMISSKIKKKKAIKDIQIGMKSKKRTRDYSPSMDVEEEGQSNKRNKKMKVPIRKLVERIKLDDDDDKNNKNKNK